MSPGALVALAAALAVLAASPEARAAGFPGVVGGGRDAIGGRGGAVIAVTNLADSGPGSLRACAEADGPRTCVFRVAGTLAIPPSSVSINITEPNLTVAGWTAPGLGFQLRCANKAACIKVNASNVVIGGLKIRPGRPGAPSTTHRGVTVNDVGGVLSDVVVMHNDLMGATDQNGPDTWHGVENSTFMFNVSAIGLNETGHGDGGEHSYGAIIGSNATRNLTIYGNLFAHNLGRCPRLKASPGPIDVRHNVMYDCVRSDVIVSGDNGPTDTNLVGNVFKDGPLSSPDYAEVAVESPAGVRLFVDASNVELSPSGGVLRTGIQVAEPGTALHPSPHPAPAVPPPPAGRDVLGWVLARAGAWPRDALSARIVADVRDGTGPPALLDDMGQHGYDWPAIPSAAAPADADADGMTDDWERARGLDPAQPGDRNGAGTDGVTNLERFLAEALATKVGAAMAEAGPAGAPPPPDPVPDGGPAADDPQARPKAAEAEAAALRRQVATLRAQLATSQAQVTSLLGQAAAAGARVADLEASLSAVTPPDVAELQGRPPEAGAESSRPGAAHPAAEALAASLGDRLAASQARVTSLQGQIAEAGARMAELEARVAAGGGDPAARLAEARLALETAAAQCKALEETSVAASGRREAEDAAAAAAAGPARSALEAAAARFRALEDTGVAATCRRDAKDAAHRLGR